MKKAKSSSSKPKSKSKAKSKAKPKAKSKNPKLKVVRGVGKSRLVPGEETVRAETRLPSSVQKAMLKKAKNNVSGYLRNLVEKDLKKAS